MFQAGLKRPLRSHDELLSRNKFLQDLIHNSSTILVVGAKASKKRRVVRMRPLPKEEPTRELVEVVAKRDDSNIKHFFPILDKQLSVKTYSEMFSALLKIEEAHIILNMRQFDMDCVCFRKEDGYLVLDVPGLAEGRPSLLPGDAIFCYPSWKKSPPEPANPILYKGSIHKTSLDSIFFKFARISTVDRGEPYNVSFGFSRAPIRRQHAALQDIDKHRFREQILFPTSISFKGSMHQACDNIIWFNSRLNPQQRQAVKGILEGKCRPSPYIVMGPPGTGKTATIVEAILQIFSRRPQCRILACSGSNAAADSIASKLIASERVTPKDMVRIVALCRWTSVPKKLKDYASLCTVEKKKEWLYHRIVVSTCTNATKFGDADSGRVFDYVFIDEASTLTEPESLLCALLTKNNSSLIVLAGDPHQLGPVVMSSSSSHLKTSLIERLCSLPPYERNEQEHDQSHNFYDSRCITKLIQSYRCCHKLIHVNSKCFYHSELISEMKQDEELLAEFKNFPIFLYGILGEDKRMPDSPSWFNYNEAKKVIEFLDILSTAKVDLSDIAVLTPYRKQIEVIRSLFETHVTWKKKNVVLPEISTVEGFQGLEKEVIILSLVRSCAESNIKHDQNYSIGFLNSPKRFNVATSRAKSLMIVVGNPYLMQSDPYWSQLLEYCCENDSYSGHPFRKPVCDPVESDSENSIREYI